MRLFHISDNDNIEVFQPRLPRRDDLEKDIAMVWAVDEASMPFLLTPRDCPRVVYRAGKRATQEDKDAYFPSPDVSFVVAIERAWLPRLESATLYVYEFDTADFTLQDEVAGYYTARTAQVPKAKYVIKDIPAALRARKVQLQVMDNLWELADRIQTTSLDWLLARMRLAQPRK